MEEDISVFIMLEKIVVFNRSQVVREVIIFLGKFSGGQYSVMI